MRHMRLWISAATAVEAKAKRTVIHRRKRSTGVITLKTLSLVLEHGIILSPPFPNCTLYYPGCLLFFINWAKYILHSLSVLCRAKLFRPNYSRSRYLHTASTTAGASQGYSNASLIVCCLVISCLPSIKETIVVLLLPDRTFQAKLAYRRAFIAEYSLDKCTFWFKYVYSLYFSEE